MKKQSRNQKKSYVGAAVILACFIAASWLVYTRTDIRAVLGGSTIRATLCDASTTPDVAIVSPQSDSIVDESPVVVSGHSIRTSQIDFFVDNVFARTVMVDDDGPFQTAIDLSEGTNTIRLDAQFSCNQTTSSYDIVLTYEPKIEPSPGEDIDTDIPPIGGGSAPGSNNSSGSDGQVEESPGLDGPIERIGKKLRIIPATGDTIDSHNYTDTETVVSWVMLAGVVFGLVLVAVPGFLVGTGTGVLGVAGGTIGGNILWFARAFGLVLVLLLIYLLQL